MVTDLTAEQWATVDAHILAGNDLNAIQAIRDLAGVGLKQAIEAHAERCQTLHAEMPERSATLPTCEALMAEAAGLPEPPVAVEALWDGDTQGWYINLSAVIRAGGRHRSHFLVSIREGEDIRLFNGQVPPWPEAETVRRIGEELADRLGVPFYFPSPEHPEDDCPGWAERDRGSPCRRCGIPLLQGGGHGRPGLCYYCYLEVERQSRTGGGQDA